MLEEDRLQIAVVEYLRLLGIFLHHSPNQGYRSKAYARKLKAMGLRAGFPDLFLFKGGRSIFIELKTSSGKLSKVQKEVHAELRAQGGEVHVCRSIDEVEKVVTSAVDA